MSDETSPRLALPLLRSGQAQKEMCHNEALTLLDLLVQGGVTAIGVNAPPASPAPGACWIVGDGPSGAWAGQAHALAGWTAGGWRFAAPRDGLTVWSAADAAFAVYGASGWQIGVLRGQRLVIGGTQVVGARAAAVGDPAGGTVIDVEARAAMTALLARVRAHGLIES